MKTTVRFLFILICSILSACGDEDEPAYGLFHLTLCMEGEADLAMGIHDAEVTISGNSKEISVGIVGEYDSFAISNDTPSWLTVKIVDKDNFNINVSALSGTDSRIGKVGFTVFKGGKSQAGVITIVQNEDLSKCSN